MRKWIRQSLNRKLVVVLSGGTILVSTLFLFLFLGLYRGQFENELGKASTQINELLQASLENAMLKRDIPGLAGIVDRLGELDDIDHVMILNPNGEVRFSSDPTMLGRVYNLDPASMAETTNFLTNERGNEVLRSINPVKNKEPCQVCHGKLDANPVNGILFVDYSAASLKQQATVMSSLLLVAGFFVLLLLATIVWWGQRRLVLKPIEKLASATARISGGHLDERVNLAGEDEFARLGRRFDDMAVALEDSVRTLERSEHFLQALINSVPDGVLVIDEEFRILNANDAYCRMSGYSLEEVLGNRCHACSHNRDIPCPPTMQTCPVVELSGEKRQLKCIQTFTTRNGDECPVEITASSFEMEIDGKLQRLTIESIRSMAEVMRFSQEQRLSGLGLLASGVAHEIYNPLASIRLGIQSAIRKLGRKGVDSDELLSDMQLVDSEIDRCVSITERLLKLSRHPELRLQPIDAHVALIETVSLLGYESDSAGIDIRINPHAVDSFILGDDSDLRMLILNLVQNAFHAMPKGGRLEISTDNRDGLLNIDFRDTGVGIPEENIKRIFDPFFSHRADRDRGTGLGLSICKSITDRFGGTIEAHNNPDGGARFHVALPLSADTPGDVIA
jgi:PAS domain S-box-containing protein